MLTKDEEYRAKYMVLIAWAADKSGLSEEVIEEVVNEAYDKNLRKDLEDYCDKLFDGEKDGM
jgi:hypothetical protein